MNAPSALAGPYDDFDQQRESAALGMWVFLGAEIIFFGALILCLVYYRASYPRDFGAASNHTKAALGTLNTGILLTSSLTMALAVRAARTMQVRSLALFLVSTIGLGAVFLAIKAFEWRTEILEGLLPGPGFRIEGTDPAHGKLFFLCYFVMTGLHGLHVAIGIALLGWILVQSLRRVYTADNPNAIEVSGLYWHFVDLVWIFLFPLLYLPGRHLHA